MHRGKSETFELVLVLGSFALFYLFRVAFEGLLGSWLLKEFERLTGIAEATLLAKLSMTAVPLFLAGITVVGLYRYVSANLRREFEAVRDDEQDAKKVAERQLNLSISNELERLWQEGADLRSRGGNAAEQVNWTSRVERYLIDNLPAAERVGFYTLPSMERKVEKLRMIWMRAAARA